MANTVQFYGSQQVMDAAVRLNQPAWALFVGSRLFSKYQDIDMAQSIDLLQQNLEVLAMNNSQASYTIKFFETDGKPIKITEKTVCDAGSFTFKLTDPEERESMRLAYTSVNGVNQQLLKRLDDLEKKLDQTTVVEEEDNSLGGVVKGLIKDPGQLAQLVQIGMVLMGKKPISELSAIGSLPAPGTPAADQIPMDQEEKLNRLGNALDVLEKADPKLIDHLEKLATMAQANPGQFALTTSMLD